MSNFPVMPAAMRIDWQNLTALVADTARRDVVPCFNGTETPREWWTSDRLAERNQAAKACGVCPVVQSSRPVGPMGSSTGTRREY